jgi:hypothetical protein
MEIIFTDASHGTVSADTDVTADGTQCEENEITSCTVSATISITKLP